MLHAHSRSNFEKKLNVSFSFDPATMLCHNCDSRDPHLIIENEGSTSSGGGSGIFFLTDQNFPPILPASGAGNCANIIRVENGTLMEIAEAMVGAVAGNAIKVGSLLVISSASFLAEVGLAGYAEELVRVTKFLLTSFENKVSVRMGVPLLLDGTNDPMLVRSMADLAAWSIEGLRDKRELFPDLSMKAMLVTLKNLGVGEPLVDYFTRVRLPVSLTSYEKKTWTSGGHEDLHNGVGPLDPVNEKFLVEVLVGELNSNFPLNLDPNPVLSRDCRKRAAASSNPVRIVTVGSSHASRLALALEAEGAEATHLRLPSWRPTANSVANAVAELIELSAADTVIVFQMLDSAAFYARTEDGSLIPARRDPTTNKFHVDGELVVAPKELFQPILKVCLPLLRASPSCNKLLLSPMPRYWKESCCQDPDHIPNIVDEKYEEELLSGLDGLRRLCKDFVFVNKVDKVRVLQPLQMMAESASGRRTSCETAEEVQRHWGPDPVHPANSCYTALAKSVLQEISKTTAGVEPAPMPRPLPAKRPAWIQEQQSGGIQVLEQPPWMRGGRQRGGRGGRGGPYGFRGGRN